MSDHANQNVLEFGWEDRETTQGAQQYEQVFVISGQNQDFPPQFQAKVAADEQYIRWVRIRPTDQFGSIDYSASSTWILEQLNGANWQHMEGDDFDDLEMTSLARTLGQVCTLMNLPNFGNDGDELPTFGGDEPTDTYLVWSWDRERLLVGQGVLKVVDRLSYLYEDAHQRMSDDDLIGFARAIESEGKLWDARLIAQCIEHEPTRDAFMMGLDRKLTGEGGR